MKFKDILKARVSVPVFVVILFLCSFLLLTFVNKASAEDWEGCDCPYTGDPGPEWVFTGDMNCDNIHFVWCANCEYDIAGYLIEYKIIPAEPTGVTGPDDYKNPWPGVGLDQGDSPIMMWLPGKKPTAAEFENDLVLSDKDRPEVVLSGAINGQYYVFLLRAVDDHGFKSDGSNENAGLAVCGLGAPSDLIIKF